MRTVGGGKKEKFKCNTATSPDLTPVGTELTAALLIFPTVER